MEATKDFKITLTKHSKLQDITLENIPFGKCFTDHMLVADYTNGQWQTPEILPYQPLQLDPSLAVLHYGQAIFEGIKAYKGKDGSVQIFRPYDNLSDLIFRQNACRCRKYPKKFLWKGYVLSLILIKIGCLILKTILYTSGRL